MFFVCLFSSFVCLFSVLCIVCISIILCIVSPRYILVYLLFEHTFTDRCRRV